MFRKIYNYMTASRLMFAAVALTLGIVIGTWPIPGPNEPANDREMLQLGGQRGDLAMIQRALSKGVDINLRDEQGLTPLILAARAGKVEAVRKLLTRGAQVNISAPVIGTALMQAALYGRKAVIRELLAHGADPNQHSPQTPTALWNAAASGDGDAENVEILIRAGADVRASFGGDTALTRARESNRQDIVEVLVKAESDREKTTLAAPVDRGPNDLLDVP